MTIPQLLGQVRRHGFAVAFRDGTPSLKPQRTDAKLPDDLLATLKAKREEVIEWFESSTRPAPPSPDESWTAHMTRPDTQAEQDDMVAALDGLIESNRSIQERTPHGFDKSEQSRTAHGRKNVGRRRPRKDDVASGQTLVDGLGGGGV